jgi:hypothetical protein
MAIFALLPTVLLIVFYALLIKVAARTYKSSVLRWKHAFALAAMAIAVGAAATALNRASGSALGLLVAVALSLAIQLALGGWYLGPRATTRFGEPLAFKGGAIVAAIAYGFLIVLGVVAAVLIPLLIRGVRG